jgi:hypothetical protein
MSRRNPGWTEPASLRFKRMEDWAEAYHQRAMTQGNAHRAMRAANLQTTVYNRSNSIDAPPTTYADYA